MYDFIWDGKPDKIKQEILTFDYDKGGLRMIDIEKNHMVTKNKLGKTYTANRKQYSTETSI